MHKNVLEIGRDYERYCSTQDEKDMGKEIVKRLQPFFKEDEFIRIMNEDEIEMEPEMKNLYTLN